MKLCQNFVQSCGALIKTFRKNKMNNNKNKNNNLLFPKKPNKGNIQISYKNEGNFL